MSSPLLLACAGLTVALGVPVLTASSVLVAHAHLAEAADAAALAAADALNGWASGEPCQLAQRVTASLTVQLAECAPNVTTGVVTVRVQRATALGVIRESARAGPPAE